MQDSNKNHPSIGNHETDSEKSHVGDAASKLLHEGKKFVNELYNDGLNKVDGTQESAKALSDELLKKVQDNPFTSLLIAAGVGFLLSSIIRKK